MSEITDTDEIPEGQIENIETPTDMENKKRMTALESRGVPINLECGSCGKSVETSVLP